MAIKEQPRIIGPVTAAAATGGTVGAAIAEIIVWFHPPAAEIRAALTILLTAALSLIGGWLVKPRQGGGDHASS